MNSDEEQDWMVRQAEEEANEAERRWQNDPEAQRAAGNIVDDDPVWIDPQAAQAFQAVVQPFRRDRNAVLARPNIHPMEHEADMPREEELDLMADMMEHIAQDRGVDPLDLRLQGAFTWDPAEGMYQWVDFPPPAGQGPIRRSGTMGRMNKRIKSQNMADDRSGF